MAASRSRFKQIALEEATSARHLARATANGDYLAADYAGQTSALASLDTSMATPWSQFQWEFAQARETWWSGQKGRLVSHAVASNVKAEAYQTAVGTAMVSMVGSVTSADVAFTGTVAPAAQTGEVALGNAEATYVRAHAAAQRDWQVAHAQAMRELAVMGT